jgi:hypothetical protein
MVNLVPGGWGGKRGRGCVLLGVPLVDGSGGMIGDGLLGLSRYNGGCPASCKEGYGRCP